MLVHTKLAGSPAAGLAAAVAADQRAGICVTRPARRTPGPGVDEIVHERRAPMAAAAALPDNRLTYSPPAGRPHPGRRRVRSPLTRHHGLRQTPRSDPARARLPMRRACTPAAFALACLRSRRSRSRTPPVLGHYRGSSRWRIPGGRRRAVPAPVLGIAFRPGRIRQGPSMYEMEGPCPASPRRLASCPALPTPRAARRGQVPMRETSLPAPPTFPGSPPGGARFRTVRTFLLPPRAPRKSRCQPFLVFPLSTEDSTESRQLSAFHSGYPRAFHNLSTGSRVSAGEHHNRRCRMPGVM